MSHVDIVERPSEYLEKGHWVPFLQIVDLNLEDIPLECPFSVINSHGAGTAYVEVSDKFSFLLR